MENMEDAALSEDQRTTKDTKVVRFAGICGILASVLPLIMILYLTSISPWFRWEANALSDIGVRQEAWLFNSAVITGGILTILFAVGLLQTLNKNKITRAGIVSLLIGSICLSLVGIFTLNTLIPHTIVSLCYFLFTPVGFVLVGIGTEEKRVRTLSIICGIAAFLAIFLLPLVIYTASLHIGFAVPELAEALIISTWVFLMSIHLLQQKK